MPKTQGFVLVEVLIVFSILATLVGLGYVRMTSIERRAPLSATVDVVVADLRGQQTKAMTGNTQGGATNGSYGMYFQAGSYTLFKGDSYNANDPANAVNTLPANVTFSTITFPNNALIFTKGSGEISGFSANNNTVTLKQGLTNETKTITANRYGTVISVQ